MEAIFPLEIWQHIFDYLTSSMKFRFYLVSKYCDNLYIERIHPSYCYNLTDIQILKQEKYRKLIHLDVERKIKPGDLSHLTALRSIASSYLNQKVIDQLDLEEVDLSGGSNSICLSHMTKLRRLNVFNSAFTQSEIIKLDVEWLNVNCNFHITDVSHMTRLRSLRTGPNLSDISGLIQLRKLTLVGAQEPVVQEQLRKLTALTRLQIIFNANISDVSFLVNLTVLEANGSDSPINQDGIQGLTKLTELIIGDNQWIIDLNHLINLKVLDISGRRCKVDQKSIEDLTKLIDLTVEDNRHINDLNHLTSLRRLDISGSSDVDQYGIRHLTGLIYLNATDNDSVCCVNHMTDLQVLHADRSCGIGQKGIRRLNLLRLSLYGNLKIHSIKHFTNFQGMAYVHNNLISEEERQRIESMELERAIHQSN